jgi:hypothetical protein
MSKPTIAIHNLETNELIEREMNDAELKIHNARIASIEAQDAIAEAKAQAKATAEGKLVALGLTTDDLRALGL